jgi:spore coat protein CotH
MNARQIRHFIGKIALLLITATEGFSQSSSALFSDSILSRVKVWINPDSLNWLHANPTSNVYLMADMVYEDGLWSDTIRKIGFRLRGNTSRFSKKKSYKISFNTFSSGRRYQGVKKINLNGQHNDPTMIREKLFYHLWNKAGMPARRTVFVKLFINNLYMGLYTGLEEFDKDWLQRVMGNNSGNLYKCTYPADLIYLGPDQNAYKSIQSSSSTGGRAYSLETNEVEDDYSGFVQLCARLQDPVTASFPQNRPLS